MAFTILKKLSKPRGLIEGAVISPSPSLSSYCYLQDRTVRVVDLKTEIVTAIIDDAQDFIWREGADVDELAVVSNDHKVALYTALGTSAPVKRQLSWAALHDPERIECVFCNGNDFVFLVNGLHLATAVLIGDVLETVWCLESPCAIIKVKVIGQDLHVLTSQGSLFGYNIQDGSQTAHWELQQDLYDFTRSVDFCICRQSETVVVCVGHAQLYAVHLGKPSNGKEASSYDSKPGTHIITALKKEKKALALSSSLRGGQCELLLDLSRPDADEHVMWMPDDRHLVLCSGTRGLQSVAAFELDANGVFSLVPSESGLPSEGSFCLVLDPRSTLGHAAAFLFTDCTATLAFGAATRRLLAEVMERTGTRAAESLSQLNQWQVMAVDPGVLLRGVQNRQLDMVAFFLKAKEEGK